MGDDEEEAEEDEDVEEEEMEVEEYAKDKHDCLTNYGSN